MFFGLGTKLNIEAKLKYQIKHWSQIKKPNSILFQKKKKEKRNQIVY